VGQFLKMEMEGMMQYSVFSAYFSFGLVAGGT
jgi:hypothetical protein